MRMLLTRKLGVWLAAGIAGWLVCGCQSLQVRDPAKVGPFFQPSNYSGEAQLPATFRRVVLLPVAGGSVASAESAGNLIPVFLAQLQRQNRFEIVSLTREECLAHFRVEEIASTAALPSDFMVRLRREYAADGVIFVDLTVYQPYRPLALGVRAKLVAADGDTRVMWAFDEVFSATNPTVANAARRFFSESDRHGVPADFTQAALQSPSRFAGYVADAVFATLPRVYAPPLSGPAK